MKSIISKNTSIRILIPLTLCSTFVLLGSTTAIMQARTPYDKERLLKVVRLNALSTEEVVQAVRQRGVDFRVTPAIESEFRSAGARPELMDALRNNYRPPASTSQPPPASTGAPATTRRTLNVPPGPPLSKNEIITLLQSGAAPQRVEQFVEVRGVNFAMSPEIAREITAAGGNRSLIGAITEKGVSGSSSAPIIPTGRMTTRTAPDYDELTDQAIAAMQANNSASAIRLLQQAAQLDSSRATAYQLLGFAELYGTRDINAAENSMQAAMQRGGSAVFYVYHDHDGFFNTYCEGSFFVSKSGVSYKAKDGNHTFQASDPDIREAAINGFVGAQIGAFHLKLRDDSKDKKKTFNFAPATRQRAEANLIIRMIHAFQ
jgi:hypothetical protein